MDDATRRLLAAGERSRIAGIARSGLVGLRAMLAEAVQRFPQDPGSQSAADVISRLDELLGAGDGRGLVPGERTTGPVPVRAVPPGQQAGLTDLVAEFTADPAVAACLDEQSIAGLGMGEGADPAWRALHLCLLRLPGQAAARWRARAAALPGTAKTVPEEWRDLPGERETVIVPPWTAPGYRTAPQAPADDEVLDALGLHPGTSHAASEAAELARLGSLLLDLTGLDENLVLALESALYQGVRRLDGELRQRYRTDLLGRLREYARTAAGSTARLGALLDIDEAVNSLTHRPPPPATSWWEQVRQQSRHLVDRSADALKNKGADVEVLPLSLRYREVRDLTSGNDVASRIGGEPGDVLACLRLWARIDGKTLPGRVMYRA